MDPISIYFFVIASILGMESPRIMSSKATVTINPAEKTFEIHQEDLFSIIMTDEDSLMVAREMQQIADVSHGKEKKISDTLTVDEITFSNTDEQLNVVIKGHYTDPSIWQKAGIQQDGTEPDRFYLINFPDWNIRSSDAMLVDNYWNWSKDKTVTIEMEPYQNIPEKYRKHRQSVLPFWQQWRDNQAK